MHKNGSTAVFRTHNSPEIQFFETIIPRNDNSLKRKFPENDNFKGRMEWGWVCWKYMGVMLGLSRTCWNFPIFFFSVRGRILGVIVRKKEGQGIVWSWKLKTLFFSGAPIATFLLCCPLSFPFSSSLPISTCWKIIFSGNCFYFREL